MFPMKAGFSDRMPLIMSVDRVEEWIRPKVKPEDLMNIALTEMVFEKVTPASDVRSDCEQLNLLS